MPPPVTPPAVPPIPHPVLRRVGVVVICVAALIGLAAIVTIFSVKSDTRRGVLEVVTGTSKIVTGTNNDRKGATNAWSTAAGEELTRANSEHYFIAYYIAQCFNGVDLAWNDRTGLPPQISIPLMFGLQPSGEIRWGSGRDDKQTLKLNNYQKSILTLSNAISTSRAQLASSAAESDFWRYLLQIFIIFVGALATIFVSVRSILDKDSRYVLAVGISAVVFSAAVTALSSLNSFVGPADTFAKTERSLVLARQLHLDLSLFAAAEKDLCAAGGFDPDNKDDPRTKKITGFSDKLREIVAPSGSTTGTPQQPGPGSGGNSIATKTD